MCLYHPSRIKIAEKDISCFKIVNKDLTSIIYSFQYEVGKEFDLRKNLERKFDLEAFLEFEIDNPGRVINKGFHSYVVSPKINSFYSILECIIPKGAQYSTGIDGDNIECYVSNKIRIIKIVNLNNEL